MRAVIALVLLVALVASASYAQPPQPARPITTDSSAPTKPEEDRALPPPVQTDLQPSALIAPNDDSARPAGRVPSINLTDRAPDAWPDDVLSLEDKQHILDIALADFDAGVAVKNQQSPAATGSYRRAAEGFEPLIKSGVRSGALYYNLANAYVRLGELGKAIVNYRRALRLMPGDENILRNLAFARKLCEVQIEPGAGSAVVQSIFFWHFGTSNASRTSVALACYAGFWILLIASLYLPRRPALVWSTRLVGLAALVLGCSVGWERVRAAHLREGVLIADNVTLRKGNGENYDPQLSTPLSQGVEFQVREGRTDSFGRDWFYVELPDGTDGWLPANVSELI